MPDQSKASMLDLPQVELSGEGSMTPYQIKIADMACVMSDMIEAGQPITREEIERRFPGTTINEMASAIVIAYTDPAIGDDQVRDELPQRMIALGKEG